MLRFPSRWQTYRPDLLVTDWWVQALSKNQPFLPVLRSAWTEREADLKNRWALSDARWVKSVRAGNRLFFISYRHLPQRSSAEPSALRPDQNAGSHFPVLPLRQPRPQDLKPSCKESSRDDHRLHSGWPPPTRLIPRWLSRWLHTFSRWCVPPPEDNKTLSQRQDSCNAWVDHSGWVSW